MMRLIRTFIIAIIAIAPGCSSATSSASSNPAAPPPQPAPVSGQHAFPGAIGYGAASKGGRGGEIIAVDNLNNDGPGSFRACVETNVPRVCVFRVGGVIRFTTRPPVIREPNLTIAGQTAPGSGITIAHGGGPEGRTPILIKNTHDIVIQNIRVRNDRIGGSRGSEDSFTIESSRNVILDHVSASWARDELVNGYGDNDWVTISNSIFAEGIPKHDKCALLASDPKGPQHLSFIGNLCAHNGDRNPDLNFPPGSCAEVVNNIFYNAQSEFAEIWESFGGVPVSLIGNSFIGGHNTGPNAIGISRNIQGSKGKAKVYMWDNAFDGDFVHVSPLIDQVAVRAPSCTGTIAAVPAAQAYQNVLKSAGAFPRDTFDQKIAANVKSRGGRIVHEPGVIPEGQSGQAYPDADRDGMDDRWEARNGADPTRSDAWADGGHNGVPNLDRFLAALLREKGAN